MITGVAAILRFPHVVIVAGMAGAAVLLPIRGGAQVRAPAGGMARGGAESSALVLEGVAVPVRSVEGGTFRAQIVTNDIGPDNVSKKHVANVTIDDLVVQVAPDAKAVSEWIKGPWTGQLQTKNGSVVTGEAKGGADERVFMNGVLTEVSLPALDASSREAGYLTLRITPERVVSKKGTMPPTGAEGAKTRGWMTSNFRVEMGDLPGNRVSRVEPITLKRKVAADQIGIFREPTKNPAKIEFSNVILTIPDADVAPWTAWHDSFLINGNNRDNDEKSGAIVLLGPDSKSEMARLNLTGCGVVSMAPVAGGPGAGRRVQVELYCEQMGFQPTP